jgi:hypothetical protein
MAGYDEPMLTREERAEWHAVMRRLQERMARLEHGLREVEARLQQVEAMWLRLQGNLALTPIRCRCTVRNGVSR